MEWLNYHHLLYFWMVAKHGSITRAGVELRLAHPTINDIRPEIIAELDDLALASVPGRRRSVS